VAANLDGNGRGGDIVSIEGRARIVRDTVGPADVPPAYTDKYGALIAAEGWTLESFLADYPVEIRIQPTRVRAW
jgi:hypothetical protein